MQPDPVHTVLDIYEGKLAPHFANPHRGMTFTYSQVKSPEGGESVMASVYFGWREPHKNSGQAKDFSTAAAMIGMPAVPNGAPQFMWSDNGKQLFLILDGNESPDTAFEDVGTIMKNRNDRNRVIGLNRA